jgi:hypothetical protein
VLNFLALRTGVKQPGDHLKLFLFTRARFAEARFYQGMCLMTPTRTNSAATKAAKTAQVSHEIFDALDFSSPVSCLAIFSPFQMPFK